MKKNKKNFLVPCPRMSFKMGNSYTIKVQNILSLIYGFWTRRTNIKSCFHGRDVTKVRFKSLKIVIYYMVKACN